MKKGGTAPNGTSLRVSSIYCDEVFPGIDFLVYLRADNF